MSKINYKDWISCSETTTTELAAMQRQVEGFGYLPRISLALVVSDADEVWIKSSVTSVINQIYPYVELCICDNDSQRAHVSEVLEDYAAADERIKVRSLPEKKSWAEAYNAAFSLSTGEFVAVLEQGDELAPDAIFRVVELLQSVDGDVIYTDEDYIDVGGRRSEPAFKPYWSPDLLLSTAYVGRLCVMRKKYKGVYREDFEGAEEHDLLLRISERTDRIHHLPEVLYHRRKLPQAPEPDAKKHGRASSRAIGNALARRGVNAAVEPGLVGESFRVIRHVGEHPTVSVIVSVPAGENDVRLVEQLEEQTSHPIRQVIVASTGRMSPPSTDRVSHPSLARAINLAASRAEGDFLVVMDARAQVTAPEWLSEMLREAQRPEVGSVGCKVLTSSGGLWHGGSLIETSRLTGHPVEAVMADGHYLPVVNYPFNFGAASAQCMMISRAKFEKVEGLDDTNLPAAFYDLDLSFRLGEDGLLNVYTPYTEVVSRAIRAVPSESEIQYMWTRWWDQLVRLLYYRRSPLHPAYHELDKEALFVSAS